MGDGDVGVLQLSVVPAQLTPEQCECIADLICLPGEFMATHQGVITVQFVSADQLVLDCKDGAARFIPHAIVIDGHTENGELHSHPAVSVGVGTAPHASEAPTAHLPRSHAPTTQHHPPPTTRLLPPASSLPPPTPASHLPPHCITHLRAPPYPELVGVRGPRCASPPLPPVVRVWVRPRARVKVEVSVRVRCEPCSTVHHCIHCCTHPHRFTGPWVPWCFFMQSLRLYQHHDVDTKDAGRGLNTLHATVRDPAGIYTLPASDVSSRVAHVKYSHTGWG